MHSCACPKWVHLRCTFPSLSFNSSNSHLWSSSPCCILALFGGPQSNITVSSSSGLSGTHTSSLPNNPFNYPSANAIHPTKAYKFSCFPSALSLTLCALFSSPVSLLGFLPSSSTIAGPARIAYTMLKPLLRFDMDLFYIFHFFWSLHSFSPMWKSSSVISIHKIGKPLDS